MNLREVRKEKGLTEREMSNAIGVTQQHYNYIENGKRRPSVALAKRIGAALGFNWALLFEEPEPGERDSV